MTPCFFFFFREQTARVVFLYTHLFSPVFVMYHYASSIYGVAHNKGGGWPLMIPWEEMKWKRNWSFFISRDTSMITFTRLNVGDEEITRQQKFSNISHPSIHKNLTFFFGDLSR